MFLTTGGLTLAGETSTVHLADRLGLSRTSFRWIGAVELAGAAGVMVGVAARGGQALSVVNDVASGVLLVVMGAAVVLQRRRGEAWRATAPALLLGGLALVQLVVRLAS